MMSNNEIKRVIVDDNTKRKLKLIVEHIKILNNTLHTRGKVELSSGGGFAEDLPIIADILKTMAE